VSLLSHYRYQYDSLILSKQTWAYPCQHLQQLLWCVVSVGLNLPEVEERKLCPIRYYANCVSTTLTVLILHNFESVYFFYSNPVLSGCVFQTVIAPHHLADPTASDMWLKERFKIVWTPSFRVTMPVPLVSSYCKQKKRCKK